MPVRRHAPPHDRETRQKGYAVMGGIICIIFGPIGHRERYGGFCRMGQEERAPVAGSVGPGRCGGPSGVGRAGHTPLPPACLGPAAVRALRQPPWGGAAQAVVRETIEDDAGGWRHTRVMLFPLNPRYEPIALTPEGGRRGAGCCGVGGGPREGIAFPPTCKLWPARPRGLPLGFPSFPLDSGLPSELAC